MAGDVQMNATPKGLAGVLAAFGQPDALAVYVSPTGRRCRWADTRSTGPLGVEFLFHYDNADGRAPLSHQMADGFWISRYNFRVLRRAF